MATNVENERVLTIVVQDGYQEHVPARLLCTLPYFQVMLNSEMIEAAENTIYKLNWSIDSLNMLISSLNNELLDVPIKCMAELLLVANEICHEELIRKILSCAACACVISSPASYEVLLELSNVMEMLDLSSRGIEAPVKEEETPLLCGWDQVMMPPEDPILPVDTVIGHIREVTACSCYCVFTFPAMCLWDSNEGSTASRIKPPLHHYKHIARINNPMQAMQTQSVHLGQRSDVLCIRLSTTGDVSMLQRSSYRFLRDTAYSLSHTSVTYHRSAQRQATYSLRLDMGHAYRQRDPKRIIESDCSGVSVWQHSGASSGYFLAKMNQCCVTLDSKNLSSLRYALNYVSSMPNITSDTSVSLRMSGEEHHRTLFRTSEVINFTLCTGICTYYTIKSIREMLDFLDQILSDVWNLPETPRVLNCLQR